jgi:hypothetical protein
MITDLINSLMSDAELHQLDKLLERRGPCNQWMRSYVDERNGHWVGSKIKIENMCYVINAGGRMEDTAEMMRLVSEDLKKARSEMDRTCKEVSTLTDVVLPLLHTNLQNIRSTRMSVENECRQCLTALRDVRKFFLESDYKTEIDRLNEFLELFARIKQLQKDGTLDLIADVMLKLATEGEPDVRK